MSEAKEDGSGQFSNFDLFKRIPGKGLTTMTAKILKFAKNQMLALRADRVNGQMFREMKAIW